MLYPTQVITSRSKYLVSGGLLIQRISRWLVEFIAKFLQFQPVVQQKILIADVSTTVL